MKKYKKKVQQCTLINCGLKLGNATNSFTRRRLTGMVDSKNKFHLKFPVFSLD